MSVGPIGDVMRVLETYDNFARIVTHEEKEFKVEGKMPKQTGLPVGASQWHR